MYPFDVSHPVVGKASVEINKPVNEVFRFVGEHFFDNYPKWALEVSEFNPLTGKSVFVGAKAKQIRQDQDGTVESILEVSEFEPPQKVSLTAVDAPFRNTYQFSAKAGQDVTELEYSFEILELEPLMWPFENAIRAAIKEGAEHTAENIKILMEHGL
jgi:Polyketide cyclase / dehydrase and lipid transport